MASYWKFRGGDRFLSQISSDPIVIGNNAFRGVLRTDSMNDCVVSWDGPTIDSINSSLSRSKVEIAPCRIEVVG